MRLKKSTSSLNVEELLNQLENAPKEAPAKEEKLSNDIVNFLRRYRLEPGDKMVSSKLLYKLYQKTSTKPSGKSRFMRYIRMYFSVSGSGMIFLNVDMYNILKGLEKKKGPRIVNRLRNKKEMFEKFCNSKDLKDGDLVIEGYVLYYLYDHWCCQRRAGFLTEYTFMDICGLYFDKVYKNDEIYFKVSNELLKHISEDVLREVRKGRQWRNEKFKKANAKK